jgi:hypothetical protein
MIVGHPSGVYGVMRLRWMELCIVWRCGVAAHQRAYRIGISAEHSLTALDRNASAVDRVHRGIDLAIRATAQKPNATRSHVLKW